MCRKRLLTVIVAYGLVVLSASAARTQPGIQKPTFAAASVRPSAPGNTFIRFAVQPGRLTADAIPLSFLISWVYQIKPNQLRPGYPKWIESEGYTIVATADGAVPVSDVREMTRRLLEERFQLALHEESETVSVWALVIDRDDRRLGPQMRPSAMKCEPGASQGVPTALPTSSETCGVRGTRGSLSGKAASVGSLLAPLEAALNAPVIDHTGLTERFDFELKWGPLADPLADPWLGEGLSIFTAVREQLGLRLRAEKGDGSVLVIDRVERPTPN